MAPRPKSDKPTLTRAEFLAASVAGAAALALPAAAQQPSSTAPPTSVPSGVPGPTATGVTDELIHQAEPLVGVSYPAEARPKITGSVKATRSALDKLRAEPFDNALAPAFVFRPEGRQPAEGDRKEVRTARRKVLLPSGSDDIAFLTVADLGELLRTRQISSLELTNYFIKRLETYGPKLHSVITLTPERALRTAEAADRLFAKNEVRSPLQGVPTGIKDLFAMTGAPTTWGAEPYRDQIIPYDSAVVERLEAAYAPICTKLSLGALAYNDIWFGGKTLNPWNPKEGSSGSSAGSAASVAAGLLPYAIGTETLGSVISPSKRCRVVGLRPTFGRISRHGAMALSWTMDKVGVLGRTPEDAALVLAALAGKDERDPSAVDRPFVYRATKNLKGRKIAVVSGTTAQAGAGELTAAVQLLRDLGAAVNPATFTPAHEAVTEVLSVEAAAAFDELTRSGRVDTMKGSLWPPEFRAAMYVTGVDYIQAMRRRTAVMKRFETELGDTDVVISNDPTESLLITTNLTGHPQVYLPLGTDSSGRAQGISLWGRLYGEGALLEVAQALLDRFEVPRLRPDLSTLP